MTLWLGDPLPFYMVEFAQCTVLVGLVYSAFEPIRTAVLATNQITKFMLIPESFYLLVLPISYLCYHYTQSPIWLIVSIITMDILTAFVRTYFAAQVTILQIKEIIKRILIPAILVAVISSGACYFLHLICSNNLPGMCLLLIINSLLLLIIIYLIGLSNSERNLINKMISKMIRIKQNHTNKQP